MMLIAILVIGRIVWQGKHKTGEHPYFHGGASEWTTEKNVKVFNEKKNTFIIAKA